MATARKLKSGNWRIRVYAGKDHDPNYVSFTAPTKREAEYEAAEFKLKRKARLKGNITVGEAMEQYISSVKNILSPTTIQSYKKIRNHNLQDIIDIKVNKLTPQQIQESINEMSKRLAPKTVTNAHGFLTTVLKYLNPEYVSRTKLPKKKKRLRELVKPEVIYAAVQGTEVELPVLLAMWLSFSKSEIRGIKKSDIKDGYLTLNRSIVDVNGKPVVKEQMKEFERTRKHKIPPYILSLIDKTQGEYVVSMSGTQISYKFQTALKKNSIPHITFHDLRHVNASVMHFLGVPNKYAMERGGWKTDETMKAVYQETFSDERIKYDNIIDSYFESMTRNMTRK